MKRPGKRTLMQVFRKERTKMKPYAFGIDLGGTTVKCGFFKNDGSLIEKWEIPTIKDNGGVQILPDIAAAIKGKLSERNVSPEDVEGVGSIPVVAANDANVAALGEQWKGGGEGNQNVVMVTLGTGVGGGIIVGGRILAGGHGAAGEIGHIQMRKDETAVCGCGKKGCLEQYASATGIVRMAHLALKEERKLPSLLDGKEITSKEIFDAAKAGDDAALGLVDTLGEMLGTALAHITAVVDPDVIVIGGGVSKAGQILIDAITKHYRTAAFHACRDTEFKLAVLGNDAGMYGAVRTVLNR